jgi:hypothetical protein
MVAARIAVLAWGLVLILGGGLLLRNFPPHRPVYSFTILGIVGIATARFTSQCPRPDVPMAACLMLYLALAGSETWPATRKRQVAAGILAGIAYLAKAYALPFFLAHVLFLALLRRFMKRPGAPMPSANPQPVRPWAALALTVLSCGLVVAPWVGLLGWKYKQFTFGSAGAINYAVVGPPDPKRVHPHRVPLWLPPPGRLAVYEVPETIDCPKWSPLDSLGNFVHQCRLIAGSIQMERSIWLSFDLLGLGLLLVVFSPLLAWLARTRPEWSWCILWVAGTVLLYCAGYVVIRGGDDFLEPRYIMPILWPVACIGCWSLTLSALEAARPRRAVAGLAIAAVAASFSLLPAELLGRMILRPTPQPYRAIAAKLTALNCQGPVAATLHPQGLYVAYHMDKPFVGTPDQANIQLCAQQLDQYGVQTLLVWENSRLWDACDGIQSFQLLTEIREAKAVPVRVYSRKP